MGGSDSLLSVSRSDMRLDVAPLAPEDAGMAKRRIYDDELHAHFVTFSCYRHLRGDAESRPRDRVVRRSGATQRVHEAMEAAEFLRREASLTRRVEFCTF